MSGDSAKCCVRVLGDLMYESDELCTHMISGPKGPELNLLRSLMNVLHLAAKSETKSSVLWIVSNVVLNSSEDLNAVCQSGILANAVLAWQGKVRSVKKEAIYLFANLITRLSQDGQTEMISALTQQY